LKKTTNKNCIKTNSAPPSPIKLNSPLLMGTKQDLKF